MSSQYLPFPTTAKEIRRHLLQIEERLLSASERFIRQQIRKPLNDLLEKNRSKIAFDVPEAEWLNVYSILRANQQVNEACNKLWCAVELVNVTNPPSLEEDLSSHRRWHTRRVY